MWSSVKDSKMGSGFELEDPSGDITIRFLTLQLDLDKDVVLKGSN